MQQGTAVRATQFYILTKSSETESGLRKLELSLELTNFAIYWYDNWGAFAYRSHLTGFLPITTSLLPISTNILPISTHILPYPHFLLCVWCRTRLQHPATLLDPI